MPVLPANFVTRLDLQRLTLKAGDLLAHTNHNELAFHLHRLMTAAASLDATMSELEPTTHANDRSLANPDGWQTEWVGQTWDFKCGKVAFSQCYLVRKEFKVPTDRYKLVLGENELIANDKSTFEVRVIQYLARGWDSLPKQMVDSCLGCFK